MNSTSGHDEYVDQVWSAYYAPMTRVAGTFAAAPTMQQSISRNGGGSGSGSHGHVSLELSLEQGKGGLLKRKKGSGSRKPSSVKKGIRKQNATSEATANDDNETVRADVEISVPSHTKQRKLVSNVWKGFERVIREDGMVRAVCKICKKDFDGSSKKGTTHLNNHLKRCERRRNRDEDQELVSSVERGTLTAPSVVRGNVVFDQERCRLDLARLIIKRQYPLNIVEHEFFKTFSNSFQPTLELPSQENIMAEILHIYQKGKEELCKYLDKLSCRFSLAIDLWKDDLKKCSYMCFTLRFIDNDWQLKEKILAVKKLEYKFDKEALSRSFQSVISSWNIRSWKFCCISVNNNCDDDIYPFIHVSSSSLCCKTYTRSLRKLLVEAGLGVIDDILQKIQKFQAAVNKVKLQGGEVFRDVSTRSDPFLMLEEALRLRDSVLRENDRDFNFNLSTEEWGKANVIYQCLKVIYDDLSNLAGTKGLTANVFFPRLPHIFNLFRRESEYDYLRQMMENTMKEKFSGYWKKNGAWDSALGMPDTPILEPAWGMAAASILDPRLKTSCLESICEWIHGTNHDSSIDRILGDNYKDYNASRKAESDSANSFDSQDSELDRYLAEPTCPSDDKFDILGWWGINTPNFPTLARMARDFLAIPMPKILSNSALGTEITRINQAFNDPDPEFVEALICAHC